MYESEFTSSGKHDNSGYACEPSRFAGFQSKQLTLEAVPIRIDYQSPCHEHFLRPAGGDWLLCFSHFKGQAKTRKTAHLDPFLIRDEFFKVTDERGAVRFLSDAGRFWVWESVTWSQFREWQVFLGWLLVDRERAMQNSEGKKAWLTAEIMVNEFFKGTDIEFTRARFHGVELNREDWRRNELDDRRRLIELRGFALDLGQSGTDGRVTLAWYNPNDGCAPEDWRARLKTARLGGSVERAPYLRVEARYILEAIAATIYVEKAHGLKHGKCKQCGKIFEIKSDHGQQYCPPRKWQKSSSCKNAFLQHKRRKVEKAKRKQPSSPPGR